MAFIPGDVNDFQSWLKQRKTQEQQPTRRQHRRQSCDVNDIKILNIVNRLGQCTCHDIARECSVPPRVAAARMKQLRLRGRLVSVGYTRHTKNQQVTVFAVADSPAAKQPVKRKRGAPLRTQIIEYLSTHEAGTNLEMSKALGKPTSSGISTTTSRMALAGELTTVETRHLKNGKQYRIFRLGTIKEKA